MNRMDYDLPFMLRYENVAWYENGKVYILDRRIYPSEIKFVECNTHEEVAKAIKDMVTQSAGPYTAAGMGMALAAYQCRNKTEKEQYEYMKKASKTIYSARPTTSNRMKLITDGCVGDWKSAINYGNDPVKAVFNRTIESLNTRYSIMSTVGEYLADMFPIEGSILTQCFGETIIGMMLRAAKKRDNNIKIYCAETRPYLQGARLTSSCCLDMGFDTTVITDNMVAYVMKYNNIDLFTSAADTITQDGYIANKIGTYQIAILASYFKIPYFVTGIPDLGKERGEDIVIEQRNPNEVLSYRGIKNTLEGVKAIYPSFDITPPNLISGVVTDKGIYSPYDLKRYFDGNVKKFY